MTPEDQENLAFLRSLEPDKLVWIVRLGLWISQSCEEHDLELSYMDDELIVFKHNKPLSEKK